MTRAIYDKAIFHRLQQMDRKVYNRARNVLPTSGDDPVDPGDETKYFQIASISLLTPGSGYTDTADQDPPCEWSQLGSIDWDGVPTCKYDVVNGEVTNLELTVAGKVQAEAVSDLPGEMDLIPEYHINGNETYATISIVWEEWEDDGGGR